MQLVVDEALVTHDKDLIAVLAIGFLLLTLIRILVNAFRSWVIVYLGNTLSFYMGSKLFHHLIHLPLGYFEKRHVGDLIERFGSMEAIQKLLTTGVVMALVDGVMATTTFVMMWIFSPSLALLVLSVVIIYTIVRIFLFSKLKLLTEEQIVAKAKEQSNFMECLRAVRSIKIFGKETDRQSLWESRYGDVANSRIKLGKFQVSYTAINEFLFGIENILVIYLAAEMVLNKELSIGMLYAFIAYKSQFSQKASALVEQAIEFKMSSLHLSRISDIALTDREDLGNNRSDHSDFQGRVSLEGISFRYSDEDPYLFENVSVSIAPGEVVALVGASGAGKSTLMKIMMGLITQVSEFKLDRKTSVTD